MTTTDSPPGAEAERATPRRRWYLLLLVVPYLWSVVAAARVGTIHALPGGVPLLLWWMLAGVVVTTVMLALVWRIDERRNADEDRRADG